MAKHHTRKQLRARKAIIAGAATATVSGALVLAQGMDVGEMLVNLTADVVPSTSCAAGTPCVIGVGGRGDATSSNIPTKLFGTVYPTGDTYVPVGYPASFDLAGSRDVGVPVLHQKILSGAASPSTSVVSYSEGTLVAEQEKRNLQAMPAIDAPDPTKLHFTQIASPFAGNGGIFGRFAYVPTFLIIDNMGPAQPTKYDTHYVVNEYDPYGDFPAYFNPLSLANSALAIQYAHPDQYYNAIDPTNPTTSPKLGPDKTVTNSAGGIDTYTIYYNKQLPLLGPIRQGADLIGVSQYVEPELLLVEPTLRVLIDAGYTDRTNADPATPTQFSLITPPGNIIGAAAALPGAAQQGVTGFLGGAQSVSPLSTPSANRSFAPAAAPEPAAAPKTKPPQTLATVLPPQQETPKTETPTLNASNVDASKLEPPTSATTSTQTTNRRGLPNLGLLVPRSTVLAGDSAATKLPAFGGNQPAAGAISGALKKLADGLTGKKPAEAAAP